MNVVIVGAGLFGCVAARALMAAGAVVNVIDDARPDSGSQSAGCVIRPSWVTSMARPDLDAALEMLDDIYGVHETEFEVRPTRKRVRCFRVEPGDILRDPRLTISRQAVHSLQKLAEFDAVVVAAGIWTGTLAPWCPLITGKYGWSHRGPPVAAPSITPWAPFRQVVAFNMISGCSWLGDGQALVERSASEARRAASLERCTRLGAPAPGTLETTRGARPYAETGGHPCLLLRDPRGTRAWAVTGGAKNGTAAAAWAARRLVREVLG